MSQHPTLLTRKNKAQSTMVEPSWTHILQENVFTGAVAKPHHCREVPSLPHELELHCLSYRWWHWKNKWEWEADSNLLAVILSTWSRCGNIFTCQHFINRCYQVRSYCGSYSGLSQPQSRRLRRAIIRVSRGRENIAWKQSPLARWEARQSECRNHENCLALVLFF